MPRTLYIMTVVIVGLTIPAVAHLLRELRVEKCGSNSRWKEVKMISNATKRSILRWNRFPSPRCASAIQIIRPLESKAEI